MYDPMNINNPETSGSTNPQSDNQTSISSTPNTTGTGSDSQNWTTQQNPYQQASNYSEYRWQGNGYQPPVQPENNDWPGSDNYTSPVPPQKPKKERKPMSRGAKIATKVVAGVLCCALVSAASVGGFAALINNGTIQVNNAGSGNSTFTITKLINSDDSNPTTSVSGSMTQQEVAAKVIPSVVCIQNYQQSELQQGLSAQGWTRGTQNGDSEDGSSQDSKFPQPVKVPASSLPPTAILSPMPTW